MNIDKRTGPVLERPDLGPVRAVDLAGGKKRKRLCKILKPLTIGANEHDFLKRDPARIKSGVRILKPDMDDGTTGANHLRGRGACRTHADSIDHLIDGRIARRFLTRVVGDAKLE